MLVEYIDSSDPVLAAARELVNTSDDGVFTIRRLSEHLSMDIEEVAETLEQLLLLHLVWCDDESQSNELPLDQEWGRIIKRLTLGKIYEVLATEDDWYRLIPDDLTIGPALYHQKLFRVVDPTVPSSWTLQHDEYEDGGERVGWCLPGWQGDFIERWYDRDPEARRQFVRDIREHYPYTWKAIGADLEKQVGGS